MVKKISLEEAFRSKSGSHPLVYAYQFEKNRDNWVKAHTPYRSSYFAIALCLQGDATLQVNLNEYQIRKGSMIFVRNDDIKQWLHRSEDYRTHNILFEKEAILYAVGNAVFEQDFSLFNEGCAIFDLTSVQEEEISRHFLQFKKVYKRQGKFRDQKLAHHLAIILYTISEYLPLEKHTHSIKRGKEIANEFIRLASKHVIEERHLDFYCQQLNLSKKHLSETIKSELDKTASQLLAEFLLLEAKVKLRETSATIEEIAFQFQFSDASAFNKFFKRHTGISPTTYRK